MMLVSKSKAFMERAKEVRQQIIQSRYSEPLEKEVSVEVKARS
jgi:hypothetical protein